MNASSDLSVELLHELAADVGALDQELLVVAVELVELAGLAGLDAGGRVDAGRVGPVLERLQFRAGHHRFEETVEVPHRSRMVRFRPGRL